MPRGWDGQKKRETLSSHVSRLKFFSGKTVTLLVESGVVWNGFFGLVGPGIPHGDYACSVDVDFSGLLSTVRYLLRLDVNGPGCVRVGLTRSGHWNHRSTVGQAGFGVVSPRVPHLRCFRLLRRGQGGQDRFATRMSAVYASC